jgi:hypothetical protein
MTKQDLSSIRDALQSLESLERLTEAGKAPKNAAELRSLLLGYLSQYSKNDSFDVRDKTPSGASWVSQFPDSKSTSDLDSSFRTGVDNFIAAMTAGNAAVSVGTTLRPIERAWLMYYSWQIANAKIDAADVPAKPGIDIEWVHASNSESVQAAADMVAGYGIVAKNGPSLTSRHTEGKAIDMTISWAGTLTINDASGTASTIDSTPRTGMNTDLIAVGATYGVIKATFAGDPPHWSTDGH